MLWGGLICHCISGFLYPTYIALQFLSYGCTVANDLLSHIPSQKNEWVFSSCSTELLWKHAYFYVPKTSKDWWCLYLVLPHLSSLSALSEWAAQNAVHMGKTWVLHIQQEHCQLHTQWSFFIPKEWGRTYHCVKWSAEIDTGDSIIQSPSAGAQPAWAAWREWWQQAMMTVPAQGLSGFWSGVGAPPFWSRTAVSQHPNVSRPIRGSASLMETWKKFGQLSTFSVVALSRELQVSHVIVLLVLCLLPKKVAWILWVTRSCWASQLSGQPGWLPSAPWLSPGCWGWISVGGFPSHCGVC